MFQTLTPKVMKISHLDRQRRFVQLYLHLSKDFRELRERPDVRKRVEDICTSTLNKLMPEPVTKESFEEFSYRPNEFRILAGTLTEVSAPTKAQRTLNERLIRDSEVVEFAKEFYGLPNAERDYCSEIAHTMGGQYQRHLHNQLWPKSKLPQNIFQ